MKIIIIVLLALALYVGALIGINICISIRVKNKVNKKLKWYEDLISCPSQIYSKIYLNNNAYKFYLRWRWNNPWSAILIKLGNSQDICDGEWFDIEIPFFKDSEYKKLEKYIEDNAIGIIKESEANNA